MVKITGLWRSAVVVLFPNDFTPLAAPFWERNV
jgi:hypothetical protein